MILLIQYKTVRLYTPFEHKNFSIAAGAGDTGLFVETLGQKPDYWYNFKNITDEFSPFSRRFLSTAKLSTLEPGFDKVTRFFYHY